MMSPDDHETMALSLVKHDEPQDAMVSAVLALAAAVNRLADAHWNVASSLTKPCSHLAGQRLAVFDRAGPVRAFALGVR